MNKVNELNSNITIHKPILIYKFIFVNYYLQEAINLLDVWTGEVVGTMHIYEISMTELAEKMGVTRGYLSMLLNCRKKTFRAERRVRAALMELIEERKCSKMEESRTS